MEGYDYEYDSDGRRHKVPVAQGYNPPLQQKRPLSGQYFAKIWGITGHCIFPAVNKITGIRRIPMHGINWDTPVDGRHKLLFAVMRLKWSEESGGDLKAPAAFLAFNMSVPFSILTGRGAMRATLFLIVLMHV